MHYQLYKTMDMENMDNFDLSEGGTALTVERTKKRENEENLALRVM